MPEGGGGAVRPPSIEALAAAFDLDTAGAEVVRAASRHVVRFPASGARTFAVPAGGAGPAREAAVAHLLAGLDVPAARIRARPIEVSGWTVTAWVEIAPAGLGVEVDATALGALAGRLHRGTAAAREGGIAPCDPLAAIRRHMRMAAAAAATTADEMVVITSEARRLEPMWHDAVDTADSAVIHGDLHRGNVVLGPDGPVLVDLELAGWGPRAFDAAPTVAFVRWYGSPRTDLADFDAAYGSSLTETCSDLNLDDVWRLWSASWAVANRHRTDEAEDEALVRLDTLRTGTAPRPWILR